MVSWTKDPRSTSSVPSLRTEAAATANASTHLWVPHNIQEANNIGSASQILQNLDLSLDLFLLHWLEHLDDALFRRRGTCHIDTFKHLRVFSPADLTKDFVIVLRSPVQRQESGRLQPHPPFFMPTHHCTARLSEMGASSVSQHTRPLSALPLHSP